MVRGGPRLRRAAALCAAVFLQFGLLPVPGNAQGSEQAALTDLDTQIHLICPTGNASPQCEKINAALLKLDGLLVPGSNTDDDGVSPALATMGNVLVESSISEKAPGKKARYTAPLRVLGDLEKSVFTGDITAARGLSEDAHKTVDHASQTTLQVAIDALTPMTEPGAARQISTGDAERDLKAAFKNLLASEAVLNTKPFLSAPEKNAYSVKVTKAKDAIRQTQQVLAQNGSKNQPDIGGVTPPDVDENGKQDGIKIAAGILTALTSTNASQALSKFGSDHPSSNDILTDLTDAGAYLKQAQPGQVINVSSDPKLDASCTTRPLDVEACLTRTKKIIDDSEDNLQGDQTSQDRRKWLERAGRSIQWHLDKPVETRTTGRPALAAAVMSFAAMVLLAIAWRKASASTPPPVAPAGAISAAAETAFKQLEQEVETQSRNYETLSNENIALQQKSMEDEQARASLEQQLQKLRDAVIKPAVDDDYRQPREAPEESARTDRSTLPSQNTPGAKPAIQAKSATPERQKAPYKEPEEFSGEVTPDYNLARQKGEDAQQRFMKFYDRPFSVSCSNLADRTVEDGKLKFKRADRTIFMVVKDKAGVLWLLPQFNVDYRPSFSMMDGIFSYPSGTSENLKLDLPGSLLPSGDGWVLDFPGEFVNA